MTEKRSDTLHDLPPGQRAIKNILRWGIDHPGIVKQIPRLTTREWQLVIEGEVANPVRLSWDDIMKLPSIVSVNDFHCVEGWSVQKCKWEGICFSTLIAEAQPTQQAQYACFECADGYTTSLPLKELIDGNALLAFRLNDKELDTSLGGPLRLVVPQKYAYKSAMWITRIAVSTNQILGFWEKRGYSDNADVWKNDRYVRSK